MEIWKDIEGYEGYYQVSNNGNVFSYKRGKLLKLRTKKNKYIQICLSKNGKSKYFWVHRLVAKAFLLNPENKPTVNHMDGNPSNNNLSNLEWTTYSENTVHAFDSGVMDSMLGENHHMSKINKRDVVNIRNDNRPQRTIAKQYGVSQVTIFKIKHNKIWKRV